MAWQHGKQNIEMKQYDEKDYEEEISAYQSGEQIINVSATTCCMIVCNRVFNEVKTDLAAIQVELEKSVSYETVRKFVVDYVMMDKMDLVIFTAFQAPRDEIFFQSPESDTW